MANSYNTNPYVIDTAMTQTLKQNGGLPQNIPIFITEIYWLNPAAASDAFSITDANGTVIRTGLCEADGQSQVFPFNPPKAVSDFKVGTLASGKIYITTL